MNTNPFAALKRLAQGVPPVGESIEQCQFCSERILPEHRHLVEVIKREILCVCRACSILFDKETASQGKYKLVPDRHVYLENFQISGAQWESLRIPVGIAFFFYSTPAQRVVAFYPSPMGPTESMLELSTWDDVKLNNVPLHDMQPDVEALLVNRAGEARDYYLVPIDECYRLVAIIRMHWRGFSGGQKVWHEVDHFFETRLQSTRSTTC